jgi:hypothetical protein
VRADPYTSFPDATVVVQSCFKVAAATSGFTWDIPTVPVSGRISIDGQPPVATSSCSGDHVRVSFVDDKGATFSTTIPCSERTGAFSLRVAPGSYRVLAVRSDPYTSFPDATMVLQSGFKVAAATSGFTWDIPTVPVSGRITIDGQPPVATSSCSGDHVHVAFVDANGGSFDTRIPCGERTGAFSLRVARGTYRVVATRSDPYTSFPDATVVAQPSLDVAAAATGLSLDIATVPVSGHITIDGQPPVATSSCSGDHVHVTFVDANGGSFDTRIPCGDATGAFSLRVARGTYRIVATRSDPNTSFPDATLTLVNALKIP